MARKKDLDDLEEKRIRAQAKMVNYKQKAKQHHDKRVNKRSFAVGDWVLRNVAVQAKKPGFNKLSPNWEGPYLVTQVVTEGIYRLQGHDGREMKNTWSGSHLRKYFY